MNDVEKARALLNSRSINLKQVSKDLDLNYGTLRQYSAGNSNIQNARWTVVNALARKYDQLNEKIKKVLILNIENLSYLTGMYSTKNEQLEIAGKEIKNLHGNGDFYLRISNKQNDDSWFLQDQIHDFEFKSIFNLRFDGDKIDALYYSGTILFSGKWNVYAKKESGNIKINYAGDDDWYKHLVFLTNSLHCYTGHYNQIRLVENIIVSEEK